ncbi:MAG: Bro-N domain-containing protein [Paracoccaceae bacterium]
MHSLIPFNFADHLVRVVMREGEPWFVLADVCKVLALSNAPQAASRLDDDEKATITNDDSRPGHGAQSLTIINESGLYSLTLTSRKEEARRFKKWITAELLPTLRKTGRYALTSAIEDDPLIAANELLTGIDMLLSGRSEITMRELTAQLGLPPQDFAVRRQLSDRLRALGWVNTVARRGATTLRVWRAPAFSNAKVS